MPRVGGGKLGEGVQGIRGVGWRTRISGCLILI
jgi:hypothetical protein